MPSTAKIVHVISHTHWDREWYMPYEAHHVKLIETMDTLLATFQADPAFRSFYLDGQTIVLEDYLQVYPEKKEALIRLCREGKISAGPWYVLQDEFLTSSEANVRNLQIGHRDAAVFGPVSKIGYFPDSFGNMGQAAQLLSQAGIHTAVFGRGVKATGFNNRVEDASELESPYSELIWESPDGTRVLGILFANWYNNGMEIPTEPEQAKSYWDHRLAMAEKYASTPHLLLMNGCDHQPVQTNLSEALRIASELYPDYEFIHSNFDDYRDALKASVPDNLSLTRGELRGQRTDGWYSLVNTASARVYIKQLNQRNQTLLERVAEPLASIAHLHGRPYPHAMMRYAWKTLMQNHPHDSICGCSVDEVYQEMTTRFAKSSEVARVLAADSAKHVASQADTSVFTKFSSQAQPFAVFQTSGYEGARVVTTEIEWSKRFFNQSEDPVVIDEIVRERSHAEGYLVDSNGERVEVSVEDLGVRFGYELPNDRFRQPYMARALRLTFEATRLPAVGYRMYAWIPEPNEYPTADAKSASEARSSLVTGERSLENEWLHITIAEDGGFTLLEKQSGQTYRDLGHYEDTGDIGNEYIYMQPQGDVALTTKGRPAVIRLVEDEAYRAAFEITQQLLIPRRADERLAEEVRTMVPFMHRQAVRSEETVPLVIVTTVSLERSGKGVRVHAALDNRAEDHRIRALFPVDIHAASHFADSIFEVAERQSEPSAEWQNPSNCQHMQAFVDVHHAEKGRGLTVAGKGLNEYEVLRDGRNTVALTLLRSVGELGDWGVFPTPEAQCLGSNEAEYMLIPHCGEDAGRFAAYQEAYRFPVPVSIAQTDIHPGPLPSANNFLAWSGEGLAFSSLTIQEELGDLMARWYNLSGNTTSLRVHSATTDGNPYESNILEEQGSTLAPGPVAVPGYRIVTMGFPRA